ncbi:MAG: hypothetical protein AAGG69_11480 [Pseudomonadota bacterium]
MISKNPYALRWMCSAAFLLMAVYIASEVLVVSLLDLSDPQIVRLFRLEDVGFRLLSQSTYVNLIVVTPVVHVVVAAFFLLKRERPWQEYEVRRDACPVCALTLIGLSLCFLLTFLAGPIDSIALNARVVDYIYFSENSSLYRLLMFHLCLQIAALAVFDYLVHQAAKRVS